MQSRPFGRAERIFDRRTMLYFRSEAASGTYTGKQRSFCGPLYLHLLPRIGPLMRFLIVFCALSLGSAVVAADLTTREQQMAKAIQATVQQAGASYAAGNFDEAAGKIREAMQQIEAATKGGSADLFDALAPAMQRIAKAHTMLEFEGVSLPPFRLPKRPDAAESKPMPTSPNLVRDRPREKPHHPNRNPHLKQ